MAEIGREGTFLICCPQEVGRNDVEEILHNIRGVVLRGDVERTVPIFRQLSACHDFILHQEGDDELLVVSARHV
jgi:hypothetical protein